MAACNACLKRVLSHSYYLNCDSCNDKVHLNCLNMVKKDDPLYLNREGNTWFCTHCSGNMFPFNHIHDDDEFLMELLENWNEHTLFPATMLKDQNRIFSPFELNDNFNSPLSDADPDIQFYQNQCNSTLNSCDYYLEDSFNKKMLEYIQKPGNYLSMVHVNIRSAMKNLDNFSHYIQGLDHVFPLIGLTETWFKPDNKDCIGMQGYRAEHNCRTNRTGGGVSLFIREDLEYSTREDLCQSEKNTESLFVEIDKEQFGKEKNIIIGVIYRPPDTDIKEFNEVMMKSLSLLKAEKKLVYLMGDFNINLLNADKHAPTQEFIDLMFSHSFIPNITKPTRVARNSATLIDNIFTNSLLDNNQIFTGALYTDISDHFPIFHIDYSCKMNKIDSKVKKRIFSQENISKFNSALSQKNWENILSMDNTQDAYTSFHNEFINMYNNCFPLKEFKAGYKTRKPWLSEGMKRQIKIKNRLYRRYSRSKCPEHLLIYQKFRNKLQGNMLRAEKEHYEKILEENQGNLKKSWRILKEVINKKKSTMSCSKFFINNKLSSDKNKIADSFNNFFINIGPTLAQDIPSDNREPTEFLKNRVVHSMVLEPVLEEEIFNVVFALKESSAGWDSISTCVVKNVYNNIKVPLCHIINLSFLTGVFPLELKVARVIPLFKAGETTQFSNYRPVSVLPAISKIFEKLLYIRILSFIKKHNILYLFQFGFRDLHSPNLALILLVDKISRALEEGDYVLGLFLDFSKAFDTVNHSIMFKKLEYYGIRGIPLNLLKSYLSNRFQYVEYNGVHSKKAEIVCGVPQGSILGPLLFLLYINDLANASSIIFSVLFADDSNLFLTGKNPNELIKIMNKEISHVVDWLRINKLSINLKKNSLYGLPKKKRESTYN